MSDILGVPRGLVCLDEDIAADHAVRADRKQVVIESRYSRFADAIDRAQPGTVDRIQAAVDQHIVLKNRQRKALGKPPLLDYFRDFALLQEVTKAACSRFCGDISVIHTSREIHAFSVTSFYTVGLDLELISPESIVPFAPEARAPVITGA